MITIKILSALPNLLTLLRLALVPLMGYHLIGLDYGSALLVFFIAALSDLLDGFLARRLGVTSRLGAALDPIADKLSMFVATVILAVQQLLPLWLAVAIVARDVLIVTGALAFRFKVGRINFTPTVLSKLNTVFEFALLLAVMAGAAQWIGTKGWIGVAFAMVFLTVAGSGLQYVALWGREALRHSGRSRASIRAFASSTPATSANVTRMSLAM